MVFGLVAFCGLFISLATNSYAQETVDMAPVSEIHWTRSTSKNVLYQGQFKPSAQDNTSPDEIMREIAFHSERLDISQASNHISFDLELDRERLRFIIADRGSSSIGQVFAVDLLQHVHGEISLGPKIFYIRNISGIMVQAKIPIMPDDVEVKELTLDLEEQVATVKARTLLNLIELVARTNVALHTVDSVEWYAPLFRNLSSIFKTIRF